MGCRSYVRMVCEHTWAHVSPVIDCGSGACILVAPRRALVWSILERPVSLFLLAPECLFFFLIDGDDLTDISAVSSFLFLPFDLISSMMSSTHLSSPVYMHNA